MKNEDKKELSEANIRNALILAQNVEKNYTGVLPSICILAYLWENLDMPDSLVKYRYVGKILRKKFPGKNYPNLKNDYDRMAQFLGIDKKYIAMFEVLDRSIRKNFLQHYKNCRNKMDIFFNARIMAWQEQKTLNNIKTIRIKIQSLHRIVTQRDDWERFEIPALLWSILGENMLRFKYFPQVALELFDGNFAATNPRDVNKLDDMNIYCDLFKIEQEEFESFLNSSPADKMQWVDEVTKKAAQKTKK